MQRRQPRTRLVAIIDREHAYRTIDRSGFQPTLMDMALMMVLYVCKSAMLWESTVGVVGL